MESTSEPFYKDKFCKAVTGFTDSELRDMVSERVVSPLDEKINLSIGRDMPRSKEDETVDRFEMFMNLNFQITLLDRPLEELYDAFKKFMTWELYCHPRDTFVNHSNYWDPIYSEIQLAHLRKNDVGVKEGIRTLVDMILHD